MRSTLLPYRLLTGRFRLVVARDGHPDFGGLGLDRELKTFGSDTDDGVFLPAQTDATSDHPRVGVEALLPQQIADDRHVLARSIVGREKTAAERRFYAEDLEQVCTYNLAT